jgi:hypothetical protein
MFKSITNTGRYLFSLGATNFVDVITQNAQFKFRMMVFNATFNNISVIFWRSVSLVEETGGT